MISVSQLGRLGQDLPDAGTTLDQGMADGGADILANSNYTNPAEQGWGTDESLPMSADERSVVSNQVDAGTVVNGVLYTAAQIATGFVPKPIVPPPAAGMSGSKMALIGLGVVAVLGLGFVAMKS